MSHLHGLTVPVPTGVAALLSSQHRTAKPLDCKPFIFGLILQLERDVVLRHVRTAVVSLIRQCGVVRGQTCLLKPSDIVFAVRLNAHPSWQSIAATNRGSVSIPILSSVDILCLLYCRKSCCLMLKGNIGDYEREARQIKDK